MTCRQVEGANKLKGIAASTGIIIGKARLVERSRQKIIHQHLVGDEEGTREVERFKEALISTKEQIIALKKRMPDSIKKHAFILETHLMIMDDSMLSDATINTILDEKINAEWALSKSIHKIRQVFEEVDEEYVRDRINDVENVGERILRNLTGNEPESLSEIDARVIIVAHDLSPADTSEIDINKVMGFITDVGGRTSHTAIMAQGLGIPAVVGLESVTSLLHDGTLLIVDGYAGEVIINPCEDTVAAYREKELQRKRFESSILTMSHLPAETIDGYRIVIKANIEFHEEVAAAKAYGAEGIGLYRTEFLYLRSKALPTEEELFDDYKRVAEAVSPFPVTIRTLDLGGDKLACNLDLAKEMNPALGLRAIRFSLKEREIFEVQLRAILRASAFGQIQLMFPMISGLQEILDARKILKEVMKGLDKGHVRYDGDIKIGVMIEIPSAVTVADILARHVDFFSIGTNDLIQYALAIDRVNEHLAHMYQPFHPAVLRMIQNVANAARGAGIRVALCGEMARDPYCAFILAGMGIDELSMHAGGIPLVKKIIQSISRKDALRNLKDIFKLETAKEVKSFMFNKAKDLLPDLIEVGDYLNSSGNNSHISSAA